MAALSTTRSRVKRDVLAAVGERRGPRGAMGDGRLPGKLVVTT
jgi:hypothetical protein